MPKIFEYFGLIFYFYSNEHQPIHVHVTKGGQETIFELVIENGKLAEINTRLSKNAEPLSAKDAMTAEKFIQKYAHNIVDKWIKFFVWKQKIRSTNITKKI